MLAEVYVLEPTVDKQLVIALIGFGTAALGLVTALLGRRKEVVHRHVNHTLEDGGRQSTLRWVGGAVVVVGLLVGVGMTAYYFIREPVSRSDTPKGTTPELASSGKLLAGPLAGRLSTTAGLTTFAPAGVTTRDSASEATFFVPAPPDGVAWNAAIYVRLPNNLLGSLGAGVGVHPNSPPGWFVNHFDQKGGWHTSRQGQVPDGLLQTRKGDRNRVRVTVDGNKGQLFLNGQLLTVFDASEVITPGDVAVVMTLTHYHGQHPDPVEMHYEDFRVTAFP